MRIALLIAGVVLAINPVEAEAQANAKKVETEDAVGAKPEDRFVLIRARNGWLRMDRDSGVISLCKASGAVFTCRLQPDERNAYEAEIIRLERMIARLKGEEPENVTAEPVARRQVPGVTPLVSTESATSTTQVSATAEAITRVQSPFGMIEPPTGEIRMPVPRPDPEELKALAPVATPEMLAAKPDLPSSGESDAIAVLDATDATGTVSKKPFVEQKPAVESIESANGPDDEPEKKMGLAERVIQRFIDLVRAE